MYVLASKIQCASEIRTSDTSSRWLDTTLDAMERNEIPRVNRGSRPGPRHDFLDFIDGYSDRADGNRDEAVGETKFDICEELTSGDPETSRQDSQ